MPPSYKNFTELFAGEENGKDFVVRNTQCDSRFLIMAPHGGRIEPGTSEIAETIAGANYSFYAFEGMKPSRNWILHVSSNLYDEPVAIAVIGRSDVIITVYGQEGSDAYLAIGGLHIELKEEICQKLQAAGFVFNSLGTKIFPATSPSNICNRGKAGRGIQIELSMGLRDALVKDSERLSSFSDSVGAALKNF